MLKAPPVNPRVYTSQYYYINVRSSKIQGLQHWAIGGIKKLLGLCRKIVIFYEHLLRNKKDWRVSIYVFAAYYLVLNKDVHDNTETDFRWTDG